ncbi:hypothetical protein A2356_01945 [Candidatus Nomurabacteria bacterium RIFOXYB1_FULL_39_16]|uniref:Transposase n=2 Tax=Candidatus Nomuraibacteriota TaxID=1752729 RepID=A0A0G0QSH3_9BACT|nr:MAG: Transposase [Candidatus Nomurabacteria bacterium GW2011_GWF2_40_12]OGJ09114.1 MAG: hypothetical protein A2356_01945 [Candidatus Nomurabacteria bacterium RIFOXYB1_FULL_39_16]OGJ14653.1 MAG: hypothetical protein A2585_01615 [Candidatus Nomurabacteria bacterium RIFOXYD1_FULL_39_12]
MRNIKFATGEFYHIYNRGVDKRDIFMDPEDVARFFVCMSFFNTRDPIGSVYEYSREELQFGSLASKKKKLINFVAFCLNQNHYHFILEPLVDDGIQKFMHRLSTGYTNYFNEKYKRSGSLFQGTYKAIHANSNEYLLHLSVYVNLNYKVHKNLNKEWMKKLTISSFKEYVGEASKSFCAKGIVLEQFNSIKEYKSFCGTTLPEILRKKEEEKELKYMLLE